MGIIALIVGIILGGILDGIVIYIVGRLGLGIEVDGFGPAFIAALVIAAIGFVVAAIMGLRCWARSAGAPSGAP